jgi:hypothetical protein
MLIRPSQFKTAWFQVSPQGFGVRFERYIDVEVCDQ